MNTSDFEKIHESALGIATNIAAITTWTPRHHADWCAGYMDAHLHILNLIDEREDGYWHETIIDEGQLRHQQTMERLRNL